MQAISSPVIIQLNCSYAAVGIFLGLAYSIYQTVCAVIRIKKESEGNVVFDFYAEKVPLIIYSYLYLLIIDSKENRYIIVYKRLHFKFLIIVVRVFFYDQLAHQFWFMEETIYIYIWN